MSAAAAGAPRSVRANVVFAAVAQGLAKAVGFVLVMVMTRALPIEDFGRWTLAAAFVAVLSPLADLGTDLHVTRLVAQRPADAPRLLGASLSLKLALGVVLVVVAGVLARLLGYRAPTPTLIVLAAVAALGGVLGSSWFCVLRGVQRLDREAVGTTVARALHLAATLAAVAMGAGVVALSGVQAAAAVAGCALVAWVARGAAPAAKFAGATAEWAGLVRGGWPFALTALVVTVYFRLDTVMLSLMAGERATGVYGACASLLFASLLLSQSLVTAVFPVIAEAGAIDAPRSRDVLRRAFPLSLAAGLPFGLGATAFAAPVLTLLFGHGYGEGAHVLELLAWTAPVLFLTNLFGHAVAASGRQRDVLVISAINAAINVSLNLVLIPRLGAVGAGWATLITELVGLAMYAAHLRAHLAWMLPWGAIARVLAANAAFAGVLWALRLPGWPTPVVLAVAVIAYGALAFGAGVLRGEDLRGFAPARTGGTPA